MTQEVTKEKSEKKQQKIVKQDKPSNHKKAPEVSHIKKLSKKTSTGFWKSLGKILKIFSLKKFI